MCIVNERDQRLAAMMESEGMLNQFAFESIPNAWQDLDGIVIG